MSELNWKIPNTQPEILREIPGLPRLLQLLLRSRGLEDPSQIEAFLYGGAEALGDPFQLPDMDKAVARIRRAAEQGERCAVFGDYDVDGITAACLMTDCLRSLGLSCEPYIPDRLEEGYGLNTAALETLKSRGVSLIVTVDCGVTAVAEADFAASLGMDMIITDHHECMEKLPRAVAVVDPKSPDCACPAARALAGVGVAFKLACALDGSAKRMLERYGDLVAVGTIADVMPLMGENRFIIKEGLLKLRDNPRPGLAALLAEANLGGKRLPAATIGFTIAPRLNAAGRLGKASVALELLMSSDPERCRELAACLCEMNKSRQALEQDIRRQALKILEADPPQAPIVLAEEGWHQGVVGIAASRLAEQFGLPAVMICLDGELGKGSCRSYGGFNLFEAMTSCANHLEAFGGHAQAVGLSIKRENIEAFRQALRGFYESAPTPEPAALEIDLLIQDPGLLTEEGVVSLDLMEPCGCGNPRPLFCVLDALVESAATIGGGKHLKFKASKRGVSFECVFFFHTAEEFNLKPGDRIDIAFTPQINEFRGLRSVQLLVTDLRRPDLAPLCGEILRRGESEDHGARLRDCLPSRNSFVKLWRGLGAAQGRISGSLEEVLDKISGCGVREVTGCLCMKVFEEFSLVSISVEGERVEIVRGSADEKADLERSALLKRLRQ